MLPASPISPGRSPYQSAKNSSPHTPLREGFLIRNSDISAIPPGKKLFDQSFDLDVRGH
jgi:hypothetical protein